MTRTVSIRQSLLRDLLLVILLLSGGILATTVFAARQTTEVLSRAYMEKAIDATNARLEGFFAPVRRELRMLGAWGEAGLLDPDDPAALNRLLVPLLQLHPQITSLMVADGRGREYLLLRSGEQWSNRITRRDEWGPRTRWLEWSEQAPEPVETWRELDYDPRARPWYRGALEARGSGRAALHWTDPYTFFTTQDPGVTASLAFERHEDGLDHVVGVDVLLSDISRFTTALDVTDNGKVLVVTEEEDSRLIGLPRDPRFETAEARRAALLRQPDLVGIPLLTDAVTAFSARDARLGSPLRFESGGEPWWGQAERFALGPTRGLLVGVVIPESDLTGRLNQLRLAIAGVTLAVLLVALLRAIVVARRFGGPIEDQVSQSDRMGRGDLGPGKPVESPLSEVRRLAEAQERMRLALRTLMKLEHDLQLAREIQQRALPERLPALPGFAIAAWGEPAEETGGDAYDVVGYRSSAGEAERTLALEGADHALLLMADATGHGIGPALSVTQVRAMLRMAARSGKELARIACHLNEQLAEDLPPGRFVTAWLGDLDARRHTLTSFSAGQAPLLHYDASRAAVEERPADAPPLGVLDRLDFAIPAPLPLRRGDVFAVISDGVFEATDPDAREFGVQRVCELIVHHAAAGPDQILAALRTALADFTRGVPARDDRTALLIQRTR
jgi:serine phosphatase RsbU (regulator of sigma subunit)